ncbi:hypothetical protein M5D96_009833 [Drosophila gunungcola]|uniref:Uncharacterized protein n=1 Tax=Drosophila gunungcola TaxID=103775 RepID=A0A9Q0BLY8_9MUSC|nr:hypothetical protein M5D96_009833 [Drosophila gunungcola]
MLSAWLVLLSSCFIWQTGQLTARDGYLESSLLPPFPQGFYLISLIVTDTNSTTRDYVGTMKFFLQAMDQIKTKKLPRT